MPHQGSHRGFLEDCEGDSPFFGIKMTEIIKENIVEDSGVRAYEIDGMRVTMPASWDDDKKQQWLENARTNMYLRRNLKMIKKSGTATLLRAHRLHGDT